MNNIDESNLLQLFSWSVSDNSTLCTADLENFLETTSSPSSSLTRLCCALITRHDILLKNNYVYFPRNLYNTLIMEAIRQDLRDNLSFLMSTWPTKEISVHNVVPYSLTALSQMLSESFVFGCLNKSLRAMLRVLQSFLDVVRKGLTPNLRKLDLSGWVLSDQMTSYIIREIINLSNDVQLQDDYHIIIECEIHVRSTYDELISFLQKSWKLKIHLHIKKLELSYLTADKIWQLLQQINPSELIGLSMPNFSNDFMTLVFTKTSSLVALRIIETSFPTLKQMLPLHLLPRLLRFGFVSYGSDLTTTIPTSTLSKLECLNIQNYLSDSVVKTDFEYLVTVPLNIRELNLSYRKVTTDNLYLWQKIFLSLAPSLVVLVIEGCIEYDKHFAPILGFILPLVNLVFLDMTDNVLSLKSMYEHVPKLGLMPKLKEIALPRPTTNCLGGGETPIDWGCEVVRDEMTSVRIEWYPYF